MVTATVTEEEFRSSQELYFPALLRFINGTSTTAK